MTGGRHAGAMSSLSREVIIEAPAERLWDIIGRGFGRIGDWASPIPASEPIDRAGSETGASVAGRVCDTGLRMFPRVIETIVDYDDSAYTLTYVAQGMPGFVGMARNRWQVSAVGDGRTVVRFDGVIETRGIAGRLLDLPLRLQLGRAGRHVLGDLKHYAEQGRPSPRKERRRRPTKSAVDEGVDFPRNRGGFRIGD